MSQHALRRKFVREAILEVLRQCRGHLLLELTLTQQVNLTLAPIASPEEIKRGLDELRAKGRADWEADEDDLSLRKWKIVEADQEGANGAPA
jgi:hypothetical protein